MLPKIFNTDTTQTDSGQLSQVKGSSDVKNNVLDDNQNNVKKTPFKGVFDMYKNAMGINKADNAEVISSIRHEEITGTLTAIQENTKQTNFLLEEIIRRLPLKTNDNGGLLPLLGAMLSKLLDGLKGLLGGLLPNLSRRPKTINCCCDKGRITPDRDRDRRRDRRGRPNNDTNRNETDIDIDRDRDRDRDRPRPDLTKPKPKPKPKPKMGKGKLAFIVAATAAAVGGTIAAIRGKDDDDNEEKEESQDGTITPTPRTTITPPTTAPTTPSAGTTAAVVGGAGLATLGMAAKMGVKALPGIGLAAGIGFGASRALDGDFTGAGLEVLSGFAALLPGFGTAASLSIQAGLLARDNGVEVAGTLASVSSSIINTTGSLATSVISSVTSNAIAAKDATISVASSLIESGAGAITSTLQAATGAIGGISGKIVGIVSGLASMLGAGVIGAVGGLAAGVISTVSTLGSTITNFASGVWQKITNSDFVNGVKDVAGSVVNTVKNVFGGDSGSSAAGGFTGIVRKAEGGNAAGNYGIYNTSGGTGKNYKVGQTDNTKMTVGELSSKQDSGAINAYGAYQIIGKTFKAAKQSLGLKDSDVMTNELQDRIYRDFLIKKARPNIYKYITGESDDQNAAILAAAQEWASVGVPYDMKGHNGRPIKKGQSYYAGDGTNKASVSPDDIGAALKKQREDYTRLKSSGLSHDEAYKQSFSSGGSVSAAPQPASNGVNNVVTARQQHGAANTATKPTFIGDSIAEGYKKASNASGDTKVGRSPQQVLTAINDNLKKDPNAYKGKQVYLSTGLSNNVQDTATVEKQLATLKAAGAIVTVYGVSNTLDKQVSGAKPTELNQKLGQMAASSGAKFLGGFNASSDNVHPTYSPVTIPSTSKPTGAMVNRKIIRAGVSTKTPTENLEVIRKKISENPNYYKGNIVELVTGINKDPKDTESVAEQIKVLAANGADVRLVKVPEEAGHRAKIAQNLNKTLSTVAAANKSQMITKPFTTATNREVTASVATIAPSTPSITPQTTPASNTGGSGGAGSTPSSTTTDTTIKPAVSSGSKPEAEGTTPSSSSQPSMSDSELIAAGKKATTWGKNAVENGMNPAFLEKYYAMAGEYANITKKGVFVEEAFRTAARQAELKAKHPEKAADVGLSMHEYGLAMDIGTDTANLMDSKGLLKKYGFVRPYSNEPWHIEHGSTRATRHALRKNDEATRSKAASLIAGTPINAGAVPDSTGNGLISSAVDSVGGAIGSAADWTIDKIRETIAPLFDTTPDEYVDNTSKGGIIPTSAKRETEGRKNPNFKRSENSDYEGMSNLSDIFNNGGMRVEGKGDEYIANNPNIFNGVPAHDGFITHAPRQETVESVGNTSSTSGSIIDFILENVKNYNNKDYTALTKSVIGKLQGTDIVKTNPMLSKIGEFITGNIDNYNNKDYTALIANGVSSITAGSSNPIMSKIGQLTTKENIDSAKNGDYSGILSGIFGVTVPSKTDNVSTSVLTSNTGITNNNITSSDISDAEITEALSTPNSTTNSTTETSSMDRFNTELRDRLSGTNTPNSITSSSTTETSKAALFSGNKPAILNLLDNTMNSTSSFLTDNLSNIKNGDYSSVLNNVMSIFGNRGKPNTVTTTGTSSDISDAEITEALSTPETSSMDRFNTELRARLSGTKTETPNSITNSTTSKSSLFSGNKPAILNLLDNTMDGASSFLTDNLSNINNGDYSSVLNSAITKFGGSTDSGMGSILSNIGNIATTDNFTKIRNGDYSSVLNSAITKFGGNTDSGIGGLLSNIGNIATTDNLTKIKNGDYSSVLNSAMSIFGNRGKANTVTTGASSDISDAEITEALKTNDSGTNITSSDISDAEITEALKTNDSGTNITSSDISDAEITEALSGSDMITPKPSVITNEPVRNAFGLISGQSYSWNEGQNAISQYEKDNNVRFNGIGTALSKVSTADDKSVTREMVGATPTPMLKVPQEQQTLKPQADVLNDSFVRATDTYSASVNKPPVVINQSPVTNNAVTNQSKPSGSDGIDAPIRVRNSESVIRDAIVSFMKKTLT